MQWSGSRGDFPSEFQWNGFTIELLNYSQLEQQSRLHLKNRVTTFREQIGQMQANTRLPPLTGYGADIVIAWLLKVEVALARSVGIDITEADLGAPQVDSGMYGDGSMAGSMAPRVRTPMPSYAPFTEAASMQPPQSYQQQHFQQAGHDYGQAPGYRRSEYDAFQSKSAQNSNFYETDQIRQAYESATADAEAIRQKARERNQSSFTFG